MSEPKGTLQLYDSSVALTLTLLEEVAAKLKGASELDWQAWFGAFSRCTSNKQRMSRARHATIAAESLGDGR